MAFKFKVKELMSGIVGAIVGGSLFGFLIYLLATDSAQLPASPIPQDAVLPLALVSGAVAFAGILIYTLNDSILAGREAKRENAKEKLEELYLEKMIEEYYELENQKMKEQIEEIKKQQNQNQQKS